MSCNLRKKKGIINLCLIIIYTIYSFIDSNLKYYLCLCQSCMSLFGFMGNFPFLIFICFGPLCSKDFIHFYLGLWGLELPYLVFLVYICPCLSVDDGLITIPPPRPTPIYQTLLLNKKCQILRVFLRILCEPKRAAV